MAENYRIMQLIIYNYISKQYFILEVIFVHANTLQRSIECRCKLYYVENDEAYLDKIRYSLLVFRAAITKNAKGLRYLNI